jgi:hypothetical protein
VVTTAAKLRFVSQNSDLYRKAAIRIAKQRLQLFIQSGIRYMLVVGIYLQHNGGGP